MNVRRVQFAFASLNLMAACILGPAVARAQASVEQCTFLQQQLIESMNAQATNKIILLERQYLTYCKDHLQSEQIALEMATLALALNDDKQHQDALGVANRCLQINSAELYCLYDKAVALYSLGHLTEARSVIEKSVKLGAITESDASAKSGLKVLLSRVNEALNERATAANPNAEASIGQYKAARIGSASVTGDVPCEGTAVGFSIDINGDLDASTVESVKRLFAEFHDQNAKVNGGLKCTPAPDSKHFNPAAYGVHYGINSRGGSVAAAMAIGRMFRQEHAWLEVDGDCISACVLILAGAVDRHIGKTAVVGIHRPFLVTSPRNPLTTEQVQQAYEHMLQDMRAYLREMNLSERLADDMLAVEPQRVRVLTQAELADYGLGRVDPAEQQRRAIENEARDVAEANQLGLDRMEYTRRKALAESICERTPGGDAVVDYTEFWNCKQRVLKTGQR